MNDVQNSPNGKAGNVIWMLSTFALIGVLVGFGVSSLDFGGGGQANVPGVQTGTQQPTGDYEDPTVDDDAFLGSEDAPVTMIVFSDYECPYCERYETQIFPIIKENFIDTGLVKYVYRDFPLTFHANAHPAAEASECAGDSNLYWEMHELLNTNYDEWTTYEGDIIELFTTYAEGLGIDATTFSACMTNGTYYDEVEADIADGRAAGINGTPSFYINGEMVVGAIPYEDYTAQDGTVKEGFESILNRLVAEAQ